MQEILSAIEEFCQENEHEVTELGEKEDSTSSLQSDTSLKAGPLSSSPQPDDKEEDLIADPLDLPTAPSKPARSQVDNLASEPDDYFYSVPPDCGSKNHWLPCTKLNTLVSANGGVTIYRVAFIKPAKVWIVDGKQFALNTVNHSLTVGARVIAKLKTSSSPHHFKLGVVGEELSDNNRHRYLVFFDSGQGNYVEPKDVREVAESSPNVWEDVHVNMRDFIRDFLQGSAAHQQWQLKVAVNQQILTERKGPWLNATVTSIDCSLVELFFRDENVHEWIHRGSKRLAPNFRSAVQGENDENDFEVVDEPLNEDEPIESSEPSSDRKQSTLHSDESTVSANFTPNHSESSWLSEEQTSNENSTSLDSASGSDTTKTSDNPKRKTKIAENSEPVSKVRILDDNPDFNFEPQSLMKYFRYNLAAKRIAAAKFVDHSCSSQCLAKTLNWKFQGCPLSKPILKSFERKVIKKARRVVEYTAPCGRTLSSMEEVHQYLQLTQCKNLQVDNFDFDVRLNVLQCFKIHDKDTSGCLFYKPDLSDGKELVPIPVINEFSKDPPEPFEYIVNRLPMHGVNINTDREFLSCCDCTDDCADKSKCACFQLASVGYKHKNPNIEYDDDKISYQWKRLYEVFPTGIYECNKNCKCSSRCLNKVVQHPQQNHLQLVQTKNRGWGVTTSHDIPKGAFVCKYLGYVYRDSDANALEHGDTYFAALDFIETATCHKEGYESDTGIDMTQILEKRFGSSEIYVMDGKLSSNIGRFLNVSLFESRSVHKLT